MDHIAVGPGGVFLLDSKRLGGSAVVDEGVYCPPLRRLGPELFHPGPGHLLSLARQTHTRVLARTRINVWVTPVMVMWGEFPQGRWRTDASISTVMSWQLARFTSATRCTGPRAAACRSRARGLGRRRSQHRLRGSRVDGRPEDRGALGMSWRGVRWGARRARSARSAGPHRGAPRPRRSRALSQ